MKRINLMTLAFVILLIASSFFYMNDNQNNFAYVGIFFTIISVILFIYSLILLLPKEFNYKTHADFKKYYDSRLKRNYWVLGYFGGGAIPIADADVIARDYAKECKVPYENVKIDEIFKSRRFKGFKYIYSTDEQIPNIDAEVLDDVFKWLND